MDLSVQQHKRWKTSYAAAVVPVVLMRAKKGCWWCSCGDLVTNKASRKPVEGILCAELGSCLLVCLCLLGVGGDRSVVGEWWETTGRQVKVVLCVALTVGKDLDGSFLPWFGCAVACFLNLVLGRDYQRGSKAQAIRVSSSSRD